MTDYRGLWARLLALACMTALGCGSGERSGGAVTAAAASGSALTAADRTHVARAAAFTAEVARYQQIAAQQRALASTYAQWAPDATDRVTTNYNAKLKAEADALAAAEDRLAAEAQKAAAFHTAEASKEMSR